MIFYFLLKMCYIFQYFFTIIMYLTLSMKINVMKVIPRRSNHRLKCIHLFI